MGLPVIGMLIGVGSSLFQGYATSQAAQAQATVANEQLKVDIENERIRAMHEQNKRNAEYLRADSANRVAVAFSGVRNISFEQGLAPFNQKQAYTDMRTIEFNKDMEVGRKKYQIGVNRFSANMESRSAMIGSLFDSADVMVKGLQKMGTLGS